MATKSQIARAVDARLAAAVALAEARRRRGDVAIGVRFDARMKRLHIELLSGVAIAIPIAALEGLSEATSAQIRSVEITGAGYGLHWPSLDLDLAVPDLISGCLGSKSWMRALARQGGRATSEAKAAAARANGKKGGRPRRPVAPLTAGR